MNGVCGRSKEYDGELFWGTIDIGNVDSLECVGVWVL